MGKTKEQSCYNCYSCLQQGKITTCAFTNKVGSECKILSSLIFFRYLATKAPFPEVTHLCWSAYRRRSALPWWNSHYSVLWIEHPPGVGGRLRAEAGGGWSAQHLLAYFGNKHELWLGAAGFHHATGKATPGMEKEKPVREIQQLNWIFRISIFLIQGTAWSLCSDVVAWIFQNNIMKARVKEMCLK